MSATKTEITVFNTKVRVIRVGEEDYFCITDLAKYKNDKIPNSIILSWINAKPNLELVYYWELRHNKDFKRTPQGMFKGYQNYVTDEFMGDTGSPAKFVAYTNAKAFIVKQGRYGGTYAHSTIALQFANYINVNFYIYILEEYQDLKKERLLRLGDPSDIKRYLTAGNYALLVSALFSQVDERLMAQPQPYKGRLPLAAEADMLNRIVFGTTAKQWRLLNTDKPTDKNMRDYGKVLDLVILNNLQFLDSMLLQWDCDKEERERILKEAYDFQYPILKRSKTIKFMQELADKAEKG
ncbi:MAG: KilA-N domain-containing protein [Saprospiraceae bacterium]